MSEIHAVRKAKRRGLMLILSSPSGAGKTSLSRQMLKDDPAMVMSISATTRPARLGEMHGQDYFFLSKSEFDRMVEEGEFLEHAKVFDHTYGTPKAPVVEALKEGKDVIFDIDWQGAQQLVEAAHRDLVRIFILPPSVEELRRRLESRAQDPADVVKRRMAESSKEISHWAEYDYVLTNDSFERCLEEIKSILETERKRRHRQIGLADFARSLMFDAEV